MVEVGHDRRGGCSLASDRLEDLELSKAVPILGLLTVAFYVVGDMPLAIFGSALFAVALLRQK